MFERLLDGVQVAAVVCNQWGDTGKGKVVDLLAKHFDLIVRGQGGNNAGHTVVAGNQELKLHVVPSGIIFDKEGKINVVGSGVAFNPLSFQEELEKLEAAGLSYDNLKISHQAKLILPQHLLLDRIREARKGKGKIGTTGRGIGPVYGDHTLRLGLTVNDMLNKEVFTKKLEKNLAEKLLVLRHDDPELIKEIMQHQHLGKGKFHDVDNIFNISTIVETYMDLGQRFKPYITDTDKLVRQALGEGKKILLEGAQGLLLSVDYGLHPFVTSSDASYRGLAKGAGLRDGDVNLVIGIAKAFYMTRVGAGPFPTEFGGEHSAGWCNNSNVTFTIEKQLYPNVSLNDSDGFEKGIAVRYAGREYGTTTGRPRRCGRFDLPLLRYAKEINGEVVALTKLDVLDQAEEIQICTNYKYTGVEYHVGGRVLRNGDIITTAIPDNEVLQHCQPLYKTFPGWKSDTTKITEFSALPLAMKEIITYVEKEAGVKVKIVSVGPDRGQTIVV